MNDLEIWVMMGKGRISALSRYMGVSRQYIHKNISKLCKDEVLDAMNKVEQYEMRTGRCAENNVLCSALNLNHENLRVRSFAKDSLIAWSEIYANIKARQ